MDKEYFTQMRNQAGGEMTKYLYGMWMGMGMVVTGVADFTQIEFYIVMIPTIILVTIFNNGEKV